MLRTHTQSLRQETSGRLLGPQFYLLLFSANSMLTAEKRRLDGELRGMQQEIDNLVVQMKNSEEKARKAVADAGQNKGIENENGFEDPNQK